MPSDLGEAAGQDRRVEIIGVFVINRTTANAPGIVVAPALLAIADEVIE